MCITLHWINGQMIQLKKIGGCMGMKFLEENLLDHLKRKEFANLQSSLLTKTFPKGSFICQPGLGANRIFIVVSGRARVYLG